MPTPAPSDEATAELFRMADMIETHAWWTHGREQLAVQGNPEANAGAIEFMDGIRCQMMQIIEASPLKHHPAREARRRYMATGETTPSPLA